MGRHSDEKESSRKDKESRDHKDKKDKKDKKRRRDDKEEDVQETAREEPKKSSKSSSHEKSESKSKENGHSSKKQRKEDHNPSKDDDDAKNDDRDVDTEKREDSEEELLKKAQEEDVEPDDEAGLDNFAISETVKKRLRAKGINKLFPIQYESFDFIRNGKDLVGKARTGTGKTFAFVLPVVERLFATTNLNSKKPRVLVLTPTRELAKQIYDDFLYVVGNELKPVCVYGGAPIGDQIRELRSGADIIVGTPGRIIDLLERACLQLDKVDHITLDEADEMLNRGFSEDVEKILSNVPKENNPVTLLFSATIPSWVKNLVKQYLKPDYVTVDLIGSDEVKASKTVEHISVFVPHWEIKDDIIGDLIKTYSGGGRTIIFVKTKAEAVRLQNLPQMTNSAQSLHGDIKQDLREMALNAFKQGNFKVLIATDVAARGLDIPQVELVLQTEPPTDYNTYIHRAGRTGRAGRSGRSLVMYLRSQKRQVSWLEQSCKMKFKAVGIPHVETMVEMAAKDAVHILQEVEPAVIPLFKQSAEDILKQFSPEEALARALAGATGYTKLPPPRSLFGRKDFQTLLMTTKRQGGYITKGTARNFLSDALGRNMPMNVYLTSCVDEASLVVDLPASCIPHLPEPEKCQVDWQLIRELPELQEEDGQNRWGQGGGRGGYGGGGYGGGYGGQGGYGRDRGGSGGYQGNGNKNDWNCTQCGFSNFGSRFSCKQCGTNKSKGGPGGSFSGGSDRGGFRSGGSGGRFGNNNNNSERRWGSGGNDRRQSSEGSSHSGPSPF